MKNKLWQTKNMIKLHPVVEEFLCGEDAALDQELVKYDIKGSLAHGQMLWTIGILTKKEWQEIKAGLKQILQLYHQGKFKIETADEDMHTAIENKLIELTGEAGKKIHTGRSRNDQVLTTLKLYIKEKLEELEEEAGELIKTLFVFGKKYQHLAMPGYTHMQKAMPSSIKLWLFNFGFMLKEDLKLVKAVYKIIDQNPLGSGAAYGVNLPLDKQLTARLLGFAKVQENALAAQNMRGKNELFVLQALAQIMITLSKLAQDVLLFTTSEFDFFKLDESLVTGSSIMPQKKNADALEIVRAKAGTVIGLAGQVAGMISGLPSGYNRDVQETKEPLIKGLKITIDSLKVCGLIIKGLKPRPQKLEKAMTADLFATDKAYGLVKQGLSFREAYKKVKQEMYES